MATNYRVPSLLRRPTQYVTKDKKGNVISRTSTPEVINIEGTFNRPPKIPLRREDAQRMEEMEKMLDKMPKKKKTSPPAKKIDRSKVKNILAKTPKQKAKPTVLPKNRGMAKSDGRKLKKLEITRTEANTQGQNEYINLLRQAKEKMDTRSNWDAAIAGATPLLAGLLAGDVGTGADVAGGALLDVHKKSQTDAENHNVRLLNSLAKAAGTTSKSSVKKEWFENPLDKFLAKSGRTFDQQQAIDQSKVGLAEREQTRKEWSDRAGYNVDMAKIEAAMATKEYDTLYRDEWARLKEAGLNDRQANTLANQRVLKQMGGEQAFGLQELKGGQAQTLQGERLESQEGIATADREQEEAIATQKMNLEEWKAKLKNDDSAEARRLKEVLARVTESRKEWEAKERFKRDERALDLKEREVNIKDFEALTKRKEALKEKKGKGLELKASDIRGLRNDYYKSKERDSTRKSSSGVSNMAANLMGHGGQDISFLYDFVRAMDPDSVVREGEIRFAQEGLPWGARLKKLWSQAYNAPAGVKILSQELKNSMMKAAILRHEQTLSTFEKYGTKQGKEIRALGVDKKYFDIDPKEFHSSLKAGRDALAKAGGGKVKPFTAGGDTPDISVDDVIETPDGKRYRNLGNGEFEEITDGGG